MGTINWRNIPGNKAMIKLHPLMLSSEGYIIKRKFSVGRGTEYRTAMVVYDSDYVFYRFKELIEQLKFQDKTAELQFMNTLINKLYD